MRLNTVIAASVGLFSTLAAGATYPAETYTLVKDFTAGTAAFFNNFNFYTGADPKGGFVQYGSRIPTLICRFQSASSGLYWNYGGVSYISADFWDQAPSGRPSLRLEGKDTFTQVLVLADFAHLPGG
jgi:hypothetical protein